jgi:hypothetical protein
MPVYRLGSGQAVVFMFNPLKGARQVLWRELTAARITTMPTSVSVSAHRDVGQTGFSRDPPNGGHTAMKRGGAVWATSGSSRDGRDCALESPSMENRAEGRAVRAPPGPVIPITARCFREIMLSILFVALRGFVDAT